MASHTQPLRRRRRSALSIATLLMTVGLLAPGPATAEGPSDFPWGPVTGIFEALAEGRHEDIPAFFCEQQQDWVHALDLDSALGSGIPGEALSDDLSGALAFEIEDLGATPIEQEFPPPPVVTLRVQASVRQAIDPAQVVALFGAFLAEGLDESSAQSMVDMIGASLEASTVDISEEVTVVQVEGEEIDYYLICSEFSGLAAIARQADADMEVADVEA